MNPETWNLVKPILAQVARDVLRTVGMYLAAKGLIQGDAGVTAFIGAGMTLAGLFWGWFTTKGYIKVGNLLQKLTAAKNAASAVKAAQVLPPAAAVDTKEKALSAKSVTGALLIGFLMIGLLPDPARAQTSLLPKLKPPAVTGNIGADIRTDLGISSGGAVSSLPAAIAQGIDPETLIKKIIAIAQPDLTYAMALATSANTNSSKVRLACWTAIYTLNTQASGANLKDSAGNALTEPPSPSIFTHAEQIAEGIDSLSPTGPLYTSCAGAAAMAAQNVLVFINALVAAVAVAPIK